MNNKNGIRKLGFEDRNKIEKGERRELTREREREREAHAKTKSKGFRKQQSTKYTKYRPEDSREPQLR